MRNRKKHGKFTKKKTIKYYMLGKGEQPSHLS